MVKDLDIDDISRKMTSFFDFICRFENLKYCIERIEKKISNFTMFKETPLEKLNANHGKKQSYRTPSTRNMIALDVKLLRSLHELGALI